MSTMKRFTAWLCSVALLISVCGCQNDHPTEKPASSPAPTPSQSESESTPPESEPLYEEALIPQETWTAAGAFAGGTGTVEDPFQIANAEQLALMAQLVNSGAQVPVEEAEESETAESSAQASGESKSSSPDEESQSQEPDVEEPASSTESAENSSVRDKKESGETVLLYRDACYVLTQDIQLNDTAAFASWETAAPRYGWVSIGTEENPFTGRLDGKNHTVSGLYVYVYSDTNGSVGLFGVASGAEILNLTVSRSSLTVRNGAADRVGAIAGTLENASTLNHCTVEDSVTVQAVNGGEAIGGLVGVAESSHLLSCLNAASLSQRGETSGAMGGLAGLYTMQKQEDDTRKAVVKVESCENTGSVQAQGSVYAGGLFGLLALEEKSAVTTFSMKKCQNTGDVTTAGTAGGMIGRSRIQSVSVTLYQCENRGQVSGKTTGGMVGSAQTTGGTISVRSCVNNGAVSGTGTTGGVTGGVEADAQSTVQISQCQNGGPVTSSQGRAAGLLGSCVLAGDSTGRVLDCSNFGVVASTGSSGAAGVVGRVTMQDIAERGNQLVIQLCRNSAAVTANGEEKSGELSGILGFLQTSGAKDRAEISQCGNNNNLTGGTGCVAGGILGRDEQKGKAGNVTVSDCYNVGDISLTNQEDDGCAGGLIGQTYQTVMSTSYNAGVITLQTANKRNGGLVGEMVTPGTEHPSQIKWCYYLNLNEKAISYTTAKDGSVRSDLVVEIAALGASDFTSEEKFVGFDFESVWSIEGAYPLLRNLN